MDSKMERNSLPETASLEMLDSCLEGKGKVGLAEGTLESVPAAVAKIYQLGLRDGVGGG